MRLVFVHDARFQRRDGGVFSCGAFPPGRWRRYLRYFDEVVVIGRDAGAAATRHNQTRSDEPGVRFRFVRDVNTVRGLALHRGRVRADLADAIADADAVVVQLPSQLGLTAAALARARGTPLVVEVAGCAWDATVHHGSPLFRLYAPLFFWRNRRAVAAADRVIYVTEGWLQRRYPTAGTAVGASNVELAAMTEADRRAREARLATLARGRPPLLGTVASLVPRYKGLQLAIEAVSRLRRDGMALSYAILGAGDQEPWRALAREMGVEDLVRFDGVREAGAGVHAWLDAIDVHLQPSFQEGLPRATMEAMSRGVACIGSVCGGLPELLPPEQLHAVGDVAGLVDRVARLAADPALIDAAARAGMARMRDYDPAALHARRDPIYAWLRDAAAARR